MKDALVSPDASRVLDPRRDAFGQLLLDELAGRAGEAILERDDGCVRPALPAAAFFAEFEEWPPQERQVFERVRGRVLDVGCGAGRHSLEAQTRGCDVVAIDVSPGAIQVARRRGVREVHPLPLAAVDPTLGTVDTVLMMCGNFGLFGSEPEGRRLLQMLHEISSPDGRIVFDSVDPSVTCDPRNLAYQARNRTRGRRPGQVTIRLRYRELTTPWFDLLNLSPDELEELLAGTGWRPVELLPATSSDYFGVLEKTSSRSRKPRRPTSVQLHHRSRPRRWLLRSRATPGTPARATWLGGDLVRLRELRPLCYILCVMERVGVRELRQNLSVYLRRVRRGETLQVTERGRPVATLQPIVDPDDRLARLQARGIPLRRGAGNLAELPPPVRVKLDRPLGDVLEELREDRI
jgi:prevent-host-death family protein